MLPAFGSSFNWKYSNKTAPSATAHGVSVIPGASNAEGSWTAMASGANIANDVFVFAIQVTSGNTTATIKDHLLDIGVDPAGGTAYVAVISNIVCGQTEASSQQGDIFLFPLRVNSGSSVAARIQGVAATAGTVNVKMDFWGKPSRPEVVASGAYAETVGTITNSGGVSVTPGNSSVEGSWVTLGTTVKPLWWWQVGLQVSNAVTNGSTYHFDLAFGDATNKVMINENMFVSLPGTTERVTSCGNVHNVLECFRQVPAGSTIYLRGTASATADTGWNAVAIGIGG